MFFAQKSPQIFFRQNLSEDCVTEENLPIPEIPGEGETLDPEDVAKFLKLILGVAVTCNNKEEILII